MKKLSQMILVACMASSALVWAACNGESPESDEPQGPVASDTQAVKGSSCTPVFVDQTAPEVKAAIVDKQLRPRGEIETKHIGKVKVSSQQYTVHDLATGAELRLPVTTTCSTSCSGSNCTTGGCNPSGDSCTACSCTGQYCLSSCSCSKTTTSGGTL